MQLQRLQLTNFRGFEHLDLALHERLTVLVGVNGSGKSSMLDAVRLLLAGALQRALPVICSSPLVFSKGTDIREAQDQSSATLTASVRGQGWTHDEQWLSKGDGLAKRAQQPDVTSIDQLRILAANDWMSLLYGVRRALLEDIDQEEVTSGQELLSLRFAYRSNLPQQSSFNSLLEWFRAREDLENEQRLRGDPRPAEPAAPGRPARPHQHDAGLRGPLRPASPARDPGAVEARPAAP
ncbi:MAG: DUF2813 domain-containing protein [Myxococcaceae bacterium]|nr:MAG: DUF2813 domain-containing protein [Myxococcaceae bacterium]